MSGISIGVIGGGASAVCLIDALARERGKPGSITVFEPSPNLWRGRAYQVDAEVIKVNAPPDDMSVRVGDLGHFERWLTVWERIVEDDRSIDRYSGTRFVPRTVYGEYLEQTAYAALGELRRQGWRVDLVGTAVTSARRTADQVVLGTESGSAGAFDYAVLCVGGDGPNDVYGLTGAPGFVPDPYPVSRNLRDIDERHHVAVIGTGLTAVDIILYLAERGHQGPITLLSRRGVLPAVRQRQLHTELHHLTKEHMRSLPRLGRELSIHDFAEIVRAELKDAGADIDALHSEIANVEVEPPVDRLRRHLAEVNSTDMGLRILQRAVPDVGPDVWPLLRKSDKAVVLRSHYRTIMSLCCPMPPESAARLLELIDAGQLEIRSGLQKIAVRSGGGFEITTSDGAVLGSDRVINAVNPAADRIPTAALPLVNSLTRSRAASLHPHGGLRLARATSQLIADGVPDPRLYGLGNIGAGSLFFTFGIPSLVDRSEDIVAAILQHAESRSAAPSEDVLLPA